MSTTADVQVSQEWTREMVRQMLTTAKYFPADQREATFGGASKSPQWIIAHCATFNALMADVFSGRDHATPGDDREPQSWEQTLAFLEAATEALCTAIAGLATQPVESFTMPWGETMPADHAIFLPGSHVVYHNGQLNYIQTILGDAEGHWG